MNIIPISKGKHKKCYLFLVLLLFQMCFFTANVHAQSLKDSNISLQAKNESVENVLKKLTKATNFKFFYDQEVINEAPVVTFNFKNVSLQTILDEITRQSHLYFNRTNNTIAVSTSRTLKKEITSDNLKNISGVIVDQAGEAIIGANVSVKGTTNGAITDLDGKYLLKVPNEKVTLVFSYIGYEKQEIALNGRTVLKVILKENVKTTDEVVIVGYGTQKKKFLIGSVSQVGSKELNVSPMTNLSNMMTGKLPGLTSVQRTGIPGNDQTTLAIRGLSTFLDSSPLVLVDGVERMINTVNPNDVENISILKDAATSAVYGVKAANGVILVTTKKGASGKAKISYDGSVTVQKNTAFPKFLNGPDYIYWYNKASNMDGYGPTYNADIQTKVMNNYDPEGKYANTDWIDALFKDHGLTQQHNVSASGGSENIKYYASLGIMDQKGIIENTSYKRYNVRSNIDGNITKELSFQLNLAGFFEKRHWPGISMSPEAYQNPIQQAIYALPIIPIYYQDEYTAWFNGTTTQSPISTIRNSGYNNRDRHQFEGSARFTYDFSKIKGLKASVFLSYDASNTNDNNFLAPYSVMAYDKSTAQYSLMSASGTNIGSFSKSASSGDGFMVRPSIEYHNTFGKHDVSGLLLYEQFQSTGSTMTGSMNGYRFSYPVDLSLGTKASSTPVSGGHDEAATIGYVGRFSYAYSKKYLAEMSFRKDGSYKFAKDKRWGFFPSAALGWVLSEENFIKETLPQINLLKVRASMGELGSDNTSAFLHRSMFSLSSDPVYVFGTNYSSYYGLSSTNPVTSSLTWSKTRSYNVGFDLNMWNGLLGVEFDWFYKVTSAIQEGLGSSFPPSLGGNYSAMGNTGKVDNRGFELVLKHENTVGDFFYRLSGNFAWAKNRVLERNQSESTPWYRSAIGNPMGQLYGFKAIGLYQTQAQLDNRPVGPGGTQNLGDIMYEDINGDGKIDMSGDFVKIGHSSIPEINYSFNMEFAWKGFNLSALWQGVALVNYALSSNYSYGAIDNTTFTRPFYEGGNAPYYLVEDCWTPEHTNAKYPRLSTIANANNAWTSSWWVVNGAYLRLKNLQLGYTIPQNIVSKYFGGISSIKAYVAGTNLLTATEFTYCDPEMGINNNGYYPQQKSYSFGLNITF